MGKLRVINYMGSNGVGKSTRTKVLVDYLMSEFSYEPFYYEIERKGKEPKVEQVGLLFSNGWLVFGKFTKDRDGWVSLDTAYLSKWEHRLNFIKELSENDDVETVFMEGYFNNRSIQGGPEKLREYGATEVHNLYTYYNDIQDFIERTNGRTGKNRGLDWAENSPGWKDNEVIRKCGEAFKEQVKENDRVVQIDWQAPKEVLVKSYFDYDYVHNEEENNSGMDEWL